VSILASLDPSMLRRLAASVADRTGDYADLFLERSAVVSLDRDPGGSVTSIEGFSEGSAMRRMTAGEVRHLAIGSLDPDELSGLAEGLRRGGGSPAPAGAGGRPGGDLGARRSGDRAPGGGDAAARPAAAVAAYLEELHREAAAALGGGAILSLRAEARSRSVAVASSEGEVTDDRRSWMTFALRVRAPGRSGAAGTLVEGGGAESAERLHVVHPPREVAARLAVAVAERRGAAPPPSGEMSVVLAPGGGGILFHEACGHMLEGDRTLRGPTPFADLLGEQVGPGSLTLVDDPTVAGLSGSRRIDDEGWRAGRNVLIDAGRLVGLLLDRGTALLAGTAPTGSARRESYRDLPLPRMTNTFVLEGTAPPEEIVASVDRGVYVADLGVGEVDTATADFAFRVRRGYLIAAGRIVAPLAPFRVTGNGVRVLRGVSMIGSDLRFDAGAGECGKEGQRARAAVGQPTVRVDGLVISPAEG
jgi:TldD protein